MDDRGMRRLSDEPQPILILGCFHGYLAPGFPAVKGVFTNIQLLENDIVGEVLIVLKHDELKEMGINSVGHRLTILKGVYDIKIEHDIPIESDHYIPLCTSYHHKAPDT